MRKFIVLVLLTFTMLVSTAQTAPGLVQPGAANLDQYLPLLKGKRVGLFANQTSMVGDEHLVDLLMGKGIKVQLIFGPELGSLGRYVGDLLG